MLSDLSLNRPGPPVILDPSAKGMVAGTPGMELRAYRRFSWIPFLAIFNRYTVQCIDLTLNAMAGGFLSCSQICH